MANQRSYRDRRNSMAARDLLSHPDSRTAPEFEDEGLREHEDIRQRLTNAHPETEYEDMRRLGPVGHLDPNLPYDDPNHFSLTKLGLSPRVRAQVFGQIGERNGTMSFTSLLEPARDDDRLNAETRDGDAPVPVSPRQTVIPHARAPRSGGY